MALIALAANDAWNIVNYRAGLVRALIGAGHDVAVIAPDGPNVARVRALGATFHPLAMQPRGRSPMADLVLLTRFRALLARIRPDAFLGFTAKPNIWGSIAARSLHIPVFANISGLGAAFARGGVLMRLMSGLYRLALKAPATVFFQNSDDRDLFVTAGIVAAERARLLPGSGIDLTHFAPRAAPSSGPCTFLFAGRLLWAKGVAEFVEAGRLLRGQGKDIRLQILGLVEDGPSAVPRAALDEWSTLGVADYLGSTDDVRSAIAAADCVVLPSFYREGVPHILLEAAAMAKPVISTDTPGCRDAVDDGVTGLLCPPRSAALLAEAMSRLSEMTSAQRRTMGAAGRDKMERQFDERLVHAAYLDAPLAVLKS
ncbi:MAG: glycosyltransferase family 4 protein [Sphingomicrobium sp.]